MLQAAVHDFAELIYSKYQVPRWFGTTTAVQLYSSMLPGNRYLVLRNRHEIIPFNEGAFRGS